MELNWTTFFLELANFLVLVWLLKRFFYAPVRRAMDERRRSIEQTLLHAEETRAQADGLKSQFETRLDDWEREKEEHRARFLADLENEKQDNHARFQKQLENERDERARAEERQAEADRESAQSEAFAVAMGFVQTVLMEVADAALEGRLVDVILARLEADDAVTAWQPQILAARTALPDESGKPVAAVRSAYPPDPAQRQRLLSILERKAGCELGCTWDVDPDLIAGLEIRIGPYLIEASLKSEMRFFSGLNVAGIDSPEGHAGMVEPA